MTGYINDLTQFTDMRRVAAQDQNAALEEVAQQFEALFLQSMLKSMRDATPGDPMFGDSNAQSTYEGMFDQQLALNIAGGRGIGLAEVLVRQLGSETLSPAMPAERGRATTTVARLTETSATSERYDWDDARNFARDIYPHADRAARKLGVSVEAVLAHAALETGWGRHIAADKNGANSLNLFGVKADARWNGPSVAVSTLEYDGDSAYREVAKFRAYENLHETFRDYVSFLTEQPRYAAVGGQGSDIEKFAAALKDGGYATDPRYVEKISRVANSDTMSSVLQSLK